MRQWMSGRIENEPSGSSGGIEARRLAPLIAAVAVIMLAAHVGATYTPDPAARLRIADSRAGQVVQGVTQKPAERVTPEQALRNAPYAPGRLIVKVKSGVKACIDCLHAQQQPLSRALGSSLLDDLNRRYGLRTIRPLRRSDASLPSLAARRRLQRLRQQRMARTAAARGGAAPKVGAFADFSSTYVFELSPWLDMEAVARDYAGEPAVVYAEPDRKMQVALTPNDPYFLSHGSWRQSFDDLWGIKIIGAPAAWDTTAGESIVVAVIDTGLDTAHPDIRPNTWGNPAEIAGNGVDDDGNGFVDDINGWNFVSDTNNVFDDFGHGTHVAGTIAAVGQNGSGVIGVAFRSQIMALKGLDAGGSGTISDLADAILYAGENHANVINASWGGVGTSQTLDDAIATVSAAGVLFVAAAGNSNADVTAAPPAGPFIPAANPHVITVSAFDHLDQKAFFSNYGPKIDVAAPGGGDAGTGFDPFRSILSLLSTGAVPDMTGNRRLIVGANYVRQAGTSMAAPHVAGTAALILAAHPSYSPAEVRQALRAGADDVDAPGYDLNAGYGRINAARSVTTDVLGVEITAPANGFVARNTTLAISGTVTGSRLASYTLEYGSGQLPTTWTTFAGPITTPVANGDLGTWDLNDMADGQYVIRVRAENTDGLVFEDRVQVTLDHVDLAEPQAGAIIRAAGPLAISGTANSGGFQRFRVEWRITTPDYVTGPWRSDGMALVGAGAAPIVEGVLATFDTSVLTGNSDVDFRVVVTQLGNVQASKEVHHVVLDPTLRAGWPQKIAGLPEMVFRLRNHLTIADLDGDGTKEVLVAFGNTVYAFRHDGTPLPGWPQQAVSAVDPARRVWIEASPAVGDLDGDGRPEVVVGATFEIDTAHNYYPTATYVWHADGTPVPGWPKYLTTMASSVSCSHGDYALADIDGDGRREMIGIVGRSVGVVDVNGNMLPGWPTALECFGGSHCAESLVAVGDVNGDGKKEIAVVKLRAEGGVTQVLALYSSTGVLMRGFPRPLGRYYGYGAWISLGPFEQQWFDFINGPVMADLDGDGKLEIATVSDTMTVRAFSAVGRAVPLKPPKAQGLPNTMCRYPRGGIASLPPILDPLTAGDLDGDGRAELLVGGHTKGSKGTARGWMLCPVPIASTDYISVIESAKSRSLFPGWPVGISYPAAISAYGPGSVAIGDIDGDGLPEVVSGSGICGKWEWTPQETPSAYRCFTVNAYDRFGTLLPGFPKATPGAGSINTVTPAIGDLAGDGLKEIAWIDWYGNLMVWDVPGTPAPEAMQWPMFRHDPAHTGALVATP